MFLCIVYHFLSELRASPRPAVAYAVVMFALPLWRATLKPLTVPSQLRSPRPTRRLDRFLVSIPLSLSVIRRLARQRRVPDRFRP
ncbi:unnamed protein product [Penicillium roqueforti FM164]|uniref:Genomic scaffold, ProqFM164S02 n=1 Tax=Penicillium roqueforti (strain FM164) TaxID=1365484 RepID=W6Q6N9_PENRF|nr:unnamed protein product [Penicillium roqueforti FM164]